MGWRTNDGSTRVDRLRALSASLEDRLAKGLAGRAAVDEYIHYNEWGLALETMVDEIGEYDSVLTSDEHDEMIALAVHMGIEESVRHRLGE